jgi:hypothetical protein
LWFFPFALLFFFGQPRGSGDGSIGAKSHTSPELSVFFLELGDITATAHISTELPVFFLKLGDSELEVNKLGFPAVTRVLSGDAVPVGAGFLALLCAHVSASTLAGGSRVRVGRGRRRGRGRESCESGYE